jgi:transcriptional regulator with PAS, ATPase and Fis domain
VDLEVVWKPGMTLKQAEQKILAAAIKKFKNKKNAARALGIGRATIYRKMNDRTASD